MSKISNKLLIKDCCSGYSEYHQSVIDLIGEERLQKYLDYVMSDLSITHNISYDTSEEIYLKSQWYVPRPLGLLYEELNGDTQICGMKLKLFYTSHNRDCIVSGASVVFYPTENLSYKINEPIDGLKLAFCKGKIYK